MTLYGIDLSVPSLASVPAAAILQAGGSLQAVIPNSSQISYGYGTPLVDVCMIPSSQLSLLGV